MEYNGYDGSNFFEELGAEPGTNIDNKKITGWVYNNPFYILGLPQTVTRQEILEYAEDQSLLGDSDEIEKAASQLTNVKRRVAAEIRWFTGTPDTIVSRILDSIRKKSRYDVRNLNILSQLNYFIQSIQDRINVINNISRLDYTFKNLNADDILNEINLTREEADIPYLESSDVIENELEILHNEIKSILSEYLDSLSPEEQASITTEIAENDIVGNNNSWGVIIEDFLDLYEIKISGKLNDYSNSIQNSINKILEMGDLSAISTQVQSIIYETKKYDLYAQPLQLRDREKGIQHKLSSTVANSVRDFGVDLVKKYGLVDEALKITRELLSIFAEAPDLVERLEKDLVILTGIQKKATEEAAIDFADMLSEYRDEIKYYANYANNKKSECTGDYIKDSLDAFHDILTKINRITQHPKFRANDNTVAILTTIVHMGVTVSNFYVVNGKEVRAAVMLIHWLNEAIFHNQKNPFEDEIDKISRLSVAVGLHVRNISLSNELVEYIHNQLKSFGVLLTLRGEIIPRAGGSPVIDTMRSYRLTPYGFEYNNGLRELIRKIKSATSNE